MLANEEVINGLSERGNHPVIRRPLRQWMLRITAFARDLERDLEGLCWPEGTMQAQRQWIGRSQGAIVRFRVTGAEGLDEHTYIEIFTTRPDTLLGVTYLVLAPEHELSTRIVSSGCNYPAAEYISASSGKSDVARMASKQKTGVSLGFSAVHPITGDVVPVWCAEYVLANYGTGAVMAVPAHDERDFEFASIYGLPMKVVVSPVQGTHESMLQLPYTQHGIIVNSGEYNGLSSEQCSAAIVSKLVQSQTGEEKEMYKLHDWVFSRQRYWGEPIPIYFPIEFIHADGQIIPNADAKDVNPKSPDCAHRICYESPIPVDETELPLLLPVMDDFSPRNDPNGCLARALDWRYFEKDGRWFARETSTMPQVKLKHNLIVQAVFYILIFLLVGWIVLVLPSIY